MKNLYSLNTHFIERYVIWITFILVLAPLFLSSQTTRDVIKGYVGWAGNPDSVTVYIDDSFSDAEKADVRDGMKRWNDADGKPKFKEVSAPPANITVKEGDPGAGNAGVADVGTDADGKVTDVTITIKDSPNPSLKETATHELGHAIGLDDTDATKNPSDVMKGTGNTNGTDGGLSKHDSTELKAAIASITVTAPAPAGNIPKKKRALAPLTAIQPGQSGNLLFDLDIPFPPLTTVNVLPAGDDLLQVNSFNLVGNLLNVDVTLLPAHGSGKFYLDIQVQTPLPDPYLVTYIGEHFVNSNPVEPLTFQCPCEIYEQGGKVHVDWKENHNYPFPTPLRAHLLVDGNKDFQAKGGDNFAVDLPAGMHTFVLELDDFQVNSCTFTAALRVEGSPLVPVRNWAIFIGGLMIIFLAWYRFKGNSGH